jgi:hypothetical protein
MNFWQLHEWFVNTENVEAEAAARFGSLDNFFELYAKASDASNWGKNYDSNHGI